MTYHGGYENSARFYDLFDTKDNIGFFARLASGCSEVLDVGAGTGRVALALAESGIRVVCIEPSEAMRCEFEIKLAARPRLRPLVELHACDGASFKLKRSLAFALMSGTFDHLLDDGERRRTLTNIGRHLVPGGRLVFDVFLGLMGESPLTPAGEVKRGDTVYRRSVGRRVRPDGTIEVTLVYEEMRAGRLIDRVTEISQAASIDLTGVRELLAATGFSIANEYGGYDAGDYHEGCEILIVEAVRRGT